ncbi:MAG TPA: hypothetical protein VIR32_10670 [Lachnospiraceae bacterium]
MKKRCKDFSLKKELKNYSEKGLTLRLDGKVSSQKEIARAYMLAESGSYMRDYVQNLKGEVVEVQFQKVKKEK